MEIKDIQQITEKLRKEACKPIQNQEKKQDIIKRLNFVISEIEKIKTELEKEMFLF